MAKDEEATSARAIDIQCVMPVQDYLLLVDAWTTPSNKNPTDLTTPSKVWVESMLEEVQSGRLEACHLNIMSNRAEDSTEDWNELGWTVGGTTRVRKPRVHVDPPTTPCQLRMRYNLYGSAWDMARIKFPTQPTMKLARVRTFK